VSCTGVGESIMRIVMAKYCVDCVERGSTAQEAAEDAIRMQSAKTPGTSGLIALDAQGRVGIVFNSRAMYRGYWTEAEGVVVPE
jgi:beta-aspartyl-peptidase (threonine type)